MEWPRTFDWMLCAFVVIYSVMPMSVMGDVNHAPMPNY
jgi:hypothetical protein